jgi:hypothetical protein
MARKSSSVLWLRIDDREMGPLHWVPVREWLLFGWLPPTLLLKSSVSDPWVEAASQSRLMTTTAAIEERRKWICGSDCASQSVPISEDRARELRAVGWIGSPSLLRNEYCAARIVHELPKLLETGAALAGGATMADLARQREARMRREFEEAEKARDIARRERSAKAYARIEAIPEALSATPRQTKVLRFFGVIAADELGNYKDALLLVPRILADDDNALAWEAYKKITGDTGHESPNLLPYDPVELQRVKQSLASRP